MLTVGRFFFLPHFWETRKKENAEIAHLLSSSSFKRNGKERRGICAAAVSNRKRCIGPFGPRLHGWMERQCEREGMIIGDRYSWRPSHRYALGGLYMPSSLAASSSSSSFSSSVALRVGDWVFLLSSHLEAASPLCFLRINSQCIPWYIHFCVNADHVVTRPHYGLVRFQVDFFFFVFIFVYRHRRRHLIRVVELFGPPLECQSVHDVTLQMDLEWGRQSSWLLSLLLGFIRQRRWAVCLFSFSNW